MPKLGMEPIRREELVAATIHEIGRAGSLDVTVGQIAKRAGVSAGLAFHYFGDKDALFLAAMRAILRLYAAEVRGAQIAAGSDPRTRLEAVIRASFGPSNFRRDVVAAWLNFYVLALTNPAARRLLTVYQRRLRSNLLADLRPLAGDAAPGIAQRLAGLIDGVFLYAMPGPGSLSRDAATAHVLAALDAEMRGAQ